MIAIVRETISIAELRGLAESGFGDLVKVVVDVRQAIMAVGGELHADEEALLMDAGSSQVDLWGINLYPEAYGDPGWIEFDSMINVRPRAGNRTRSVEDPGVQLRIRNIVSERVR